VIELRIIGRVASPLRFQVRNLEAIDGTPIVDVKITLESLVE